jgi:hypothetical protein
LAPPIQPNVTRIQAASDLTLRDDPNPNLDRQPDWAETRRRNGKYEAASRTYCGNRGQHDEAARRAQRMSLSANNGSPWRTGFHFAATCASVWIAIRHLIGASVDSNFNRDMTWQFDSEPRKPPQRCGVGDLPLV